jgi:hypothetical protein
MNPYDRIADLTVEELKTLIRQTVQEATAEVLIEFSMAAERDAELLIKAEIADLLRNSLDDGSPGVPTTVGGLSHSDD